MRRLVAVLLVAVLALTLAGCGGGGDKKAATTQPTAASTPPPPSDEEPLVDRTPLAEVKFEAFPERSSVEATGLPSEITDRLDSDQPMILFFFDKSQKTADDQRKEIDAVLKEYRGTIDLLAYDIGQKIGDGVHDEADTQAIGLSRALGVDFTPYIVLVDKQGLITWRYRGFVDRTVVEREILRATE